MRLRGVLSVLLAIALLLGTALPSLAAEKAPGVSFTDVSADDWSLPYVLEIHAKGLMQGTGNGRFEPQAPLTRAQAATVAVRLMALEAEAQAVRGDIEERLPFTDRAAIPDWAKPYIAVAVDRDILPVAEDGLFRPDEKATRLWVSVLLVRALGFDLEAQAKMQNDLPFRDAELIPASLVGYVAAAIDHELVTGFPDRTFQPNQPLTRAQAAALLSRTDLQLGELGRLRPGTLIGDLVRADTRARTLTLALDDRERSVALADDAVLFLDGRRATLADLPARSRLSLVTDRYGKAVLVMARAPEVEESKTVRGKLTALFLPQEMAGGLGLIVVAPTQGAEKTFSLARAVTVTYQGRSFPLSDLQAGDQVAVRVAAGVVTAITLEKRTAPAPAPKEEAVTGVITAVKPLSTSFKSSIVVKTAQGTRTLTLASDVVIKYGRTRLDLADLQTGDKVTVKLVYGVAVAITVDEPAKPAPVKVKEITGVIQEVAGVSITFQSSITVKTSTDTLTIAVGPKPVITRNGRKVTLSELEKGDRVTVKLEGDVATEITVTTPAPVTLEGTIIGIFHAKITLKTKDGKQQDLTLADGAPILYNNRKLTIDQLYTGDQVTLQLQGSKIIRIDVKLRVGLEG
ncbi:MAG TPA: S-layer homology domain-containing protein [Symbiobacteriaceae bacterium]|nr:S-layer homology domain-containing protein [Symbiobacteriaceae bacterium]